MKLGKTYFSGSLTFDEGNNFIGPNTSVLTGSLSGSVKGTFEGSFAGNTLTNISGAFDAVSASIASDRLKNTTDTLTGDLTVTGTLTAQDLHVQEITSSVLYSSGSNIFGNDSTNTHTFTGTGSFDAVGIGTTGPRAKLSVYGNGFFGSSDQLQIIGSDNGGISYFAADGTTFNIRTTAYDNPIVFSQAVNGEVMRISNSGSLGIGTSNPDRQLEIYGTNDGYIKLDGGRANNHGYTLGSDAYGFIIYDDTLASYRFVIDQNSGHVGIGDTSPYFSVEVNSTGSAAFGNVKGIGRFRNSSDSSKGIVLGYDTTSQTGVIFAETAAPASNLAFYTYNGSAWGERMRIDSSGNIMIGKDSQSGNAALTVKSPAGGNTGLMLIEGDTTNDGHGLYATTDNKFVITRFTNGSYSDNFVMDSSGNVSLASATSLDFNVADFAQIKFKESGAITIDSDNNQSSRNFQFKDGDGSSLMFIGDNGNVGIGTTSPNATLHVSGGVHFGPDSGVLNPSIGQVLIETASGGTPILQFYPYGSSVMFLKSDGTTGVLGWNSGADREVNINNEGAGAILVGIGTGAPAETLHVNKNAASNIVGGYFTNSQANTGAESVSLAFGLNRSGGDFVRQVKAITFAAEQQWTGTPSTVDGYLSFSTIQDENVKERMRISSGGIVYIMGATASVNNSLQFQYNSTAGSAEIYSKSTAGNTHFEFYASDSGTTNEVMRITKEGRITSATDNKALTAIHPRSIAISHGGSTSWTYDLDPVALFGTRVSGGHLHIRASGWQTRLNAGYIVYRNDGGGSSVIGTGNVTYYQTVHSDNGGTDAAIAVSLPSSSTNVIRISFSGWHSNNHGFECVVTTTN